MDKEVKSENFVTCPKCRARANFIGTNVQDFLYKCNVCGYEFDDGELIRIDIGNSHFAWNFGKLCSLLEKYAKDNNIDLL